MAVTREPQLDLGALQGLLDRIADVTVACVGDLMLDRFVYGEVARVSPEAPVPVLRATRSLAMPGAVGTVDLARAAMPALYGRGIGGATTGYCVAAFARAACICAKDNLF